MTTSHLENNEFAFAKYNYVIALASERIEDILGHLGVSYEKRGKKVVGYCPIHNGDNPNAWHMFLEGEVTKGNWACYTHNCHHKSKFGPSFIKFIQGILSSRGNRQASFKDAVKYLTDFLKIDIDNIKVDYNLLEKSRFANQYQTTKTKTSNVAKLNRIAVRDKLIIPSEYYINRGYSAKILNKFDVGRYKNPNHKMANRIVVPIYDEKSYFMGCMARTIYPKCDMCSYYHKPDSCPITPEEKRFSTKWVNSTGFARNNCLYNYWHSKDVIQKTGVAVIVEGPGDVWRLEEAGIYNSVALFGVVMGNTQRTILEKSGAITLIILTDNDEAGKTSRETIKDSCGKLFTLVFPEIEKHDIGETSVSIVKDDLKPYIESFNI